MAGNFWCFGCCNWINKNKPFIVISCIDEDDCNNCDYFCDESCLELAVLMNIDFSKCNCCDSDVKKEIIDLNKK